MREYIEKLLEGKNLSREQASDAMDKVLDNGATHAQIAAFLILLRAKGETLDEIIGCAQMLKKKAKHINPNIKDYIDIVGTGGDGSNTFNISTTSAFVIAAAGVPVAKNGNRAISSRSGSVDLLEKLGISTDVLADKVKECIETLGIGFMAAQFFHPCMKNVAKVRSELKVRTIFNILGPISNTSNAKCQLIGVYSESLVQPIAEAIKHMGVERGMVLCCKGIDEITTVAPTQISEIKEGRIENYYLMPQDYGFNKANVKDLCGGTAKENAEITKRILMGEKGAKRDTILLNAGACIYLQGTAKSIQEGIKKAEYAIDTGKAINKMNDVALFMNKARGL